MPDILEKPRPVSVILKLDTSHRERLKSLAIAKNRSAHFLMKEAIERYLKTEEAQQAILQSVDESIAHYEATGLHVSFDEFKTWTQEVKLSRSTQLPVCHA